MIAPIKIFQRKLVAFTNSEDIISLQIILHLHLYGTKEVKHHLQIKQTRYVSSYRREVFKRKFANHANRFDHNSRTCDQTVSTG